jgi:hypothetical protein
LHGWLANVVLRWRGGRFLSRPELDCWVKYDVGRVRGPYAHSDWLQLMHDFGLVGIVLLAWLHAAFLALIRRGFRLRNPVTPSLAMGYTILFLVNIYSGHLLGPTAIYFGLLLVCGALAISTARQTVPVWSREWTG